MVDNIDYTATISNPLQFHLVVDYVATGLSIRQVKSILDITKHHVAQSRIGALNEGKVASYTRVVCALNLQTMYLNNPQ